MRNVGPEHGEATALPRLSSYPGLGTNPLSEKPNLQCINHQSLSTATNQTITSHRYKETQK